MKTYRYDAIKHACEGCAEKLRECPDSHVIKEVYSTNSQEVCWPCGKTFTTLEHESLEPIREAFRKRDEEIWTEIRQHEKEIRESRCPAHVWEDGECVHCGMRKFEEPE